MLVVWALSLALVRPPLGRSALGAARVAVRRAASVALLPDAVGGAAAHLAAADGAGGALGAAAPSLALAFADQGQNLAGIFFQASLLPYLAFLLFLADSRNGTPPRVLFGFQFLLLFVLATIPTGIIAKSAYAESLADADWLHGGAELLLTATNLIILAGLRAANAGDVRPNGAVTACALALFATLGGTCAFGLGPLGLGAHAPFLLGVGALPADALAAAPIALHAEPANALSVPTWAVHSSSVLEWVACMAAMWQWAETAGNERWKGLVWAMLPLHASGIAACTYHLFYNAPDLKPLVTAQAGLTLVGNGALALAAGRLAWSNGWRPGDLLRPLTGAAAGDALADARRDLAPMPTDAAAEAAEAVKIGASSLALAYIVKYGSLGTELPLHPQLPLAVALVATPPALLALQYARRGADGAMAIGSLEAAGGGAAVRVQMRSPAGGGGGGGDDDGDDDGDEEGKGAKGGVSFADIKKYGVAGTVAYALTELVFWLVSLPIASFLFVQASGHLPDFSDNADRAAVLAYVFAGVNLARLVVPLRFGVALAAVPWVDANIVSRFGAKRDDEGPRQD
ncbi:hypothetical protein KFE25_005327 [Diacronema lutheri]|uniref:Uncharacterized protein n=3 Tax=Diacronema lutheri TaxID=2081491 RepID=A0A8J6C8V4_DIALT|nr:hypothetical protein KFE25_005327 [Diacronema lutheri]